MALKSFGCIRRRAETVNTIGSLTLYLIQHYHVTKIAISKIYFTYSSLSCDLSFHHHDISKVVG